MQNFNSGTFVMQGHYKAFIPKLINRDWSILDMEVVLLLSQADRALGRLDMYSEYVNIDLFIKMHIAKEASQSSKIEGTQTNMQDVFMDRADLSPQKRDDWQEVHNYINAMNQAVSDLAELPFSSRLIKRTHHTLMSGVRGKHKLPGEYRTSQNWIGGATLNDAVFVPPPHNEINGLMSDLEKFANNASILLPSLIKTAFIHYQFETIHPFLDGNGRVGRLLITLYLVSQGLLKKPILYLSDFFERHRSLYYANLMKARIEHDINQWLKFFLAGVIETAKKGVQTFDEILQLDKSLPLRLSQLGNREKDARKVIEELYQQPVTDAKRVESIIEKSSVSAYRLISDLEKLEILVEVTGSQRGRIYVFRDYLELFQRV